MARQGFMAPAPSHSSSSRDVAAGRRTLTHHESTVSSLHRIAEAHVAVGGLRNTYDIYIADRRVLPPSHSGSKHRWWERPSKHVNTLQLQLSRSIDTFSLHRTVAVQHKDILQSPLSNAHSRTKQRRWKAHRSSRCQASSVDAFKTRTLAGLHRASDLTHSIFLQLTMYADPLAGRV